MNKKGVVVEVGRRHCIVLVDGCFVSKKACKEWNVGDDVEIEFNSRRFDKTIVFSMARILVAAILVFGIGFASYAKTLTHMAHAYMTIDASPSFELIIGEKMEVLGFKALNVEAEGLMDRVVGWKGDHVERVAFRIIELCQEQGYITDSSEVVIATTVDERVKGSKKDKTVQELTKLAQRMENDEYTLIAIQATPEHRSQASRKGISTGRHIVNTYRSQIDRAQNVRTHQSVETGENQEIIMEVEHQADKKAVVIKPDKDNDALLIRVEPASNAKDNISPSTTEDNNGNRLKSPEIVSPKSKREDHTVNNEGKSHVVEVTPTQEMPKASKGREGTKEATEKEKSPSDKKPEIAKEKVVEITETEKSVASEEVALPEAKSAVAAPPTASAKEFQSTQNNDETPNP